MFFEVLPFFLSRNLESRLSIVLPWFAQRRRRKAVNRGLPPSRMKGMYAESLISCAEDVAPLIEEAHLGPC